MNSYTKALNLMLVIGMFLTVYVTNITHEANELWPDNPALKEQTRLDRESHPVNQPKPRTIGTCKVKAWEGFQHLKVIDLNNDMLTLDFDVAYERNHNETDADDVWVICYAP